MFNMIVSKIIFITLFVISRTEGVCYFSQEQQGVYATQSIAAGPGEAVQYLELTVLPDSIPVWGFCHRRLGNNVLLYDGTGGTDCVRCFHLTVRSPHLLEIHTESLDKCYTNEQAALQTCPTREHIRNQRTREIMLYKTALLTGSPLPPAQYCPINGRYSFTYDLDDGAERARECPAPTSRLSNCPRGNVLTLQFRRCSFEDFSKTYECLGDWQGSNGQRYLALRDTAATSSNDTSVTDTLPRYRCAMYSIDGSTGRVSLSLSSDSTCSAQLSSPWVSYETLALSPIQPPPPPHSVGSRFCQFPSWSQGQWEQVKVEDNQLSYTDLQSFKTYRVFCLEDHITENTEPHLTGLIPVFAQSQCGEEVFTCLSVQERSSNVMEFQMGTDEEESYRSGLCAAPETRSWGAWLTQGRVDRFRQSACPVAGEYTGALPDAPHLCAKLYSDCNNPEIMFYTVFSCANRSEVFEEREYRCLGQWFEEQVTYTYTERRDASSYECFAGVVVDDGEIYIMEAGPNCIRDLNVLTYGMKLVKQAACLTHQHTSRGDSRHKTSPTSAISGSASNGQQNQQYDVHQRGLQGVVPHRQRPPFPTTPTVEPSLTSHTTIKTVEENANAGSSMMRVSPVSVVALVSVIIHIVTTFIIAR